MSKMSEGRRVRRAIQALTVKWLGVEGVIGIVEEKKENSYSIVFHLKHGSRASNLPRSYKGFNIDYKLSEPFVGQTEA